MLCKIPSKYLYVRERVETVNRNKAIPLPSPSELSVSLKQNIGRKKEKYERN